MHVLVTGGAGFIGSHLVEHHLRNGDQVHAVDDLSTGAITNIRPFLENPDFRFDEADILTWSNLERAVCWADRVYHMAAVVGMHRVLAEPTRVLAINVAGTERVLRAAVAAKWNPRILIASSSEVYGAQTDLFHEEADLRLPSAARSRWNYAVSKLADEALGLSYARKFNIHVSLVRLFNTVGPRQTGRYGMVVPRFVKQAVNREPITVYGDGSQTRCFCDVRDTVVALELLLSNHGSAGEIVNVGNDREMSIRSLAEMVRTRSGSAAPIVHVPYNEAYGEEFDDVMRRKPVLGKLTSLTGFRHQWRLEDTLDELIAHRAARAQNTAVAGGV